MNSKEALLLEKKKRKAVAKKRICWLLAIVDIALLVYVAIQIIIIIQG